MSFLDEDDQLTHRVNQKEAVALINELFNKDKTPSQMQVGTERLQNGGDDSPVNSDVDSDREDEYEINANDAEASRKEHDQKRFSIISSNVGSYDLHSDVVLGWKYDVKCIQETQLDQAKTKYADKQTTFNDQFLASGKPVRRTMGTAPSAHSGMPVIRLAAGGVVILGSLQVGARPLPVWTGTPEEQLLWDSTRWVGATFPIGKGKAYFNVDNFYGFASNDRMQDTYRLLEALFSAIACRGADIPTAICMDTNLQVASDSTYQSMCQRGGWIDAATMQGGSIVEQPTYSLPSIWKAEERHNTRIDVILLNVAAQRLFKSFEYVERPAIKQHRQLVAHFNVRPFNSRMKILIHPRAYPVEHALPMDEDDRNQLADYVWDSFSQAFDDALAEQGNEIASRALKILTHAAEIYLGELTKGNSATQGKPGRGGTPKFKAVRICSTANPKTAMHEDRYLTSVRKMQQQISHFFGILSRGAFACEEIENTFALGRING